MTHHPASPAAKSAKTDAKAAPGGSREAPIHLDFSSDEEGKSTHALQAQMTKGMAKVRAFNHTVNVGESRELCGKIQTLLKLIHPVSPVEANFKEVFLNTVTGWGSSSRRDDSVRVLCEGLCLWMKKTAFPLERKFLLQIEKHSCAHKKFAAVKPMLFTTASGWVVEECNFTLDGADPLE